MSTAICDKRKLGPTPADLTYFPVYYYGRPGDRTRIDDDAGTVERVSRVDRAIDRNQSIAIIREGNTCCLDGAHGRDITKRCVIVRQGLPAEYAHSLTLSPLTHYDLSLPQDPIGDDNHDGRADHTA